MLLLIKKFDMVLGIDWFSKHHATIDIGQRMVTFAVPGEEFVYRAYKSFLFAMNISSARAK